MLKRPCQSAHAGADRGGTVEFYFAAPCGGRHDRAVPPAASSRSAPHTLEAVLERLTYVNEENGYTVARVATSRGSDLLTVVGALLGNQLGESLRMQGWWSSHSAVTQSALQRRHRGEEPRRPGRFPPCAGRRRTHRRRRAAPYFPRLPADQLIAFNHTCTTWIGLPGVAAVWAHISDAGDMPQRARRFSPRSGRRRTHRSVRAGRRHTALTYRLTT